MEGENFDVMDQTNDFDDIDIADHAENPDQAGVADHDHQQDDSDGDDSDGEYDRENDDALEEDDADLYTDSHELSDFDVESEQNDAVAEDYDGEPEQINANAEDVNTEQGEDFDANAMENSDHSGKAGVKVVKVTNGGGDVRIDLNDAEFIPVGLDKHERYIVGSDVVVSPQYVFNTTPVYMVIDYTNYTLEDSDDDVHDSGSSEIAEADNKADELETEDAEAEAQEENEFEAAAEDNVLDDADGDALVAVEDDPLADDARMPDASTVARASDDGDSDSASPHRH